MGRTSFIFENVAGIAQSKHKDVVDFLKKRFNDLGYSVSYSILNSANYGVPQRRERYFLIGILGSEEPAFPLPSNYKSKPIWEEFIYNLSTNNGIGFDKWRTVEEAFKEIPSNYKNRSDFVEMNISEVVQNRMKFIKQGENFKVLPMELRPDCWKTGKHQGNDTFGRLKSDEPSITIRTAAYNPAKGKYIHPFENRGLNSIELAKLQSFPNEWVFKCKNRDRVTLVSVGKQIGNAVPPLLAEKLGKSIKIQLDSIYY